MKTTLVLCAAAMVLTNSIGSAYAADGDRDGQSTLFTSVEAQQQQHSLAVGALHSPPLFTRGGVGVRVWTPMEQAYNAVVNGDLAAKDIWGPG
jgi:hypothetical protein